MDEGPLTVTFGAEVADSIGRAAAIEGVSPAEWLARIAVVAADAEKPRPRTPEEIEAAVREIDELVGPFTPEDDAWARDVLSRTYTPEEIAAMDAALERLGLPRGR